MSATLHSLHLILHAAMAVVALSGCGRASATPAAIDAAYADAKARMDAESPAPRCDAPDCSCETCPGGGCACGAEAANGPNNSAGSPELIVVSAAWCAPCRAVHAAAKGLSGVRFVDFDSDRAEAARLWNAAGHGDGSSAPANLPPSLPAFVQVRDGRPARWWLVGAHRVTHPAQLAEMRDAPRLEATQAARAGDAFDATSFPQLYACGFYGSATVIGPGRALTAKHCVVDPLTNEHRSPIRLLFGGEQVVATVVATAEKDDLALLTFEREGCAAVPIAESPPADGAAVISHGYPGGQSRVDRPFRITRRDAGGGVLVATYNASVPFRQGESGAGVLDARGRLVGVIAATNDRNGLVVDHAAVVRFLASHQ